jgi:type II secretory pathway predicted ATPase ExeA
VSGYIKHRLTHVGGKGTEFTEEAIGKVAQNSGGVPRLVNKLCDLGLVYAAAEKSPVVSAAIIDEVIADNIFVSAMDSLSEAAE